MPPVEGTVHADLQGHTRRVSTVCLGTDARQALSASLDRTLRLWEVPSGRCLRVLEGHASDVNAAALSRDGRWVAGTRGRPRGYHISRLIVPSEDIAAIVAEHAKTD